MNDLKRLLHYLGPYRKDMILGALLVFAETLFELIIPILMADIIDVGVANHDIPFILQREFKWGFAQSYLCLPVCFMLDTLPVPPMDLVPGSGRLSTRNFSIIPSPTWIILKLPRWSPA